MTSAKALLTVARLSDCLMDVLLVTGLWAVCASPGIMMSRIQSLYVVAGVVYASERIILPANVAA